MHKDIGATTTWELLRLLLYGARVSIHLKVLYQLGRQAFRFQTQLQGVSANDADGEHHHILSQLVALQWEEAAATRRCSTATTEHFAATPGAATEGGVAAGDQAQLKDKGEHTRVPLSLVAALFAHFVMVLTSSTMRDESLESMRLELCHSIHTVSDLELSMIGLSVSYVTSNSHCNQFSL
eukprot:jgi/Chlat1/8130/Chrsp75S07599